MLGRVAAADDDFPLVISDGSFLTVTKSTIRFRQLCYVLAEKSENPAIIVERLGRISRRRVETEAGIGSRPAGVGDQHPTHRVFLKGHPEIDVKTPGEPAGTANVVRMHVRDNDMFDWRIAHDTGKRSFPDRLALVVAKASVDYRPAVAVGEQPKIDVLERKQQWHA